MDFVQVKSALSGSRDGEMTDVNRIECAAKKSNAPLARVFPGNAM
jgi:hypothetical protein